MPSSWHEFHQHLVQSSSTLNFQRGFATVCNRHRVLTRFADPAALLDHLHRGDSSPDQKNLLDDECGAEQGNELRQISVLADRPDRKAIQHKACEACRQKCSDHPADSRADNTRSCAGRSHLIGGDGNP